MWFSEKGPFIFIIQVDWLWFIIRMTDSVSSFSIPVTASLPPLEWPLSHQSGSYELRIEVQPKPHHRAHYETEGSRGAVKAPTGGHPVVQVLTWVFFFLLFPYLSLADSLLLSYCRVLIGLRCVSQPLILLSDGKFEIELVSEANPASQKPEKKVFLSWIRIEMIFMFRLLLPSLFDWEMTRFLPRFLYWRFLKPSFCV